MPPKMSEEWDKFVKQNPLLPQPTTIADFRTAKHQRGLLTQTFLSEPSFSKLADNVNVENTTITLPEVTSHEFGLRVYRPARQLTEQLPVMLYFHGGYWCAGDANSEDFGCRAIIANGNNIIIASFEYRLIPDVNWQTQFSDAEYAVKWVAHNAGDLGGDITKGFLLGGAEAGAHLAAICAIRARSRYPNIKITGQNLIVPTTIAWPDAKIPAQWVDELSSHVQNSAAPVLSETLYEMFVNALSMPDDDKRKGENFPVWGPLEGLPPAYLPMDECDPIRDQGFLYAKLLSEAGVKTRTDYYRGLPNMFVQFPELPSTLKAGGHLAAGIAWLLQEKK